MWKPDRTSKKPLYQQIAEFMERRINYGEYPPGSVLPSERKLASQLQVNRSTIVQAYEELRASGLIESRVGFGTRVSGDKWGFTPKHAANWRLYEESGAFFYRIFLSFGVFGKRFVKTRTLSILPAASFRRICSPIRPFKTVAGKTLS